MECGAQQAIARWITLKRRQRWLHRFRAECPGSVLLRSGGFQVSLLDRDRFLADQGTRFTRGKSKI
jgi:hypothetical protein